MTDPALPTCAVRREVWRGELYWLEPLAAPEADPMTATAAAFQASELAHARAMLPLSQEPCLSELLVWRPARRWSLRRWRRLHPPQLNTRPKPALPLSPSPRTASLDLPEHPSEAAVPPFRDRSTSAPDEVGARAPGARGVVRHPCVVVQDDVFNRSRLRSVVVCGLTSNLHRATEPGNVLLAAGEGGLPKASVVLVSQIDAVDRARLTTRIGALSDDRIEEILNGLRFQQRSFQR